MSTTTANVERRAPPMTHAPPASVEAELVRAIGREPGGPAEAELCRLLAPRVRLFAWKRLRQDAAVADLVQDVLVAVVDAARRGLLEEPERIRAYALTVCRNRMWRDARQERRAAALDATKLPWLAETVEAPTSWLGGETARLDECMAALTERARQVLYMSFHEDRAAEDIATTLGIERGNVRAIRHRALAQLRTCLHPKGMS